MRLMAKRIEKKHIEPLELRQRFLGDVTVVGEIGRSPESVTHHGQRAVPNRDRLEQHSEQIDGRTVKLMARNARNAPWMKGFSLEGVREHAPKTAEGFRHAVDRDALRAAIVERTQVIQTHDVIGVGVSVEDGVEPRDTGAESLLAQVWGRVNQDVSFPAGLGKRHED